MDESAEEVVSTDGGRLWRVIDGGGVGPARWGELQGAVGPVLVVMLAVHA